MSYFPNTASSIGTIDGQSRVANGLVMSANTLYAQTANGSYPGLVSTTTQTFAGDKTFSNNLILTGASTGVLHSTSGTVSSSLLVNADVAASGSANIARNKLASGGVSRVLFNDIATGYIMEVAAFYYDSDATILYVPKIQTTGNITVGTGANGTVNALTVSSSSSLQITSSGGTVYMDTVNRLRPDVNNATDIGSSSYKFKDLFLAGNATVYGISTGQAGLTLVSRTAKSINNSNASIAASDGQTITVNVTGGPAGNIILPPTYTENSTPGVYWDAYKPLFIMVAVTGSYYPSIYNAATNWSVGPVVGRRMYIFLNDGTQWFVASHIG